MAFRPGVPDPPAGAVLLRDEKSRHHLGAQAVLGRLHHESLARVRIDMIELLQSTTILACLISMSNLSVDNACIS